MIFKMKVPKQGAFMIKINNNFSFSKVRCGPSMILAGNYGRFPIFGSGLENHCFVLICQKIAQNRPWWVLGGFLVLTESIMSVSFWNLIYEMKHTCCWLILPFWVSISSFSLSGKIFYGFFMFFREEKFCLLQWKINII